MKLAAVFLALAFTACAAFGAKTPAQRFYAAQGAYTIAVEQAAVYTASPNADPAVAEALRAIDAQAGDVIEVAVRARNFANASDRDQALAAAASALDLIAVKLRLAIAQAATEEP